MIKLHVAYGWFLIDFYGMSHSSHAKSKQNGYGIWIPLRWIDDRLPPKFPGNPTSKIRQVQAGQKTPLLTENTERLPSGYLT